MISIFRSARATRRPRVRFVPTVDGLEGRVVLSALNPAKVHHAPMDLQAPAKAHHAPAVHQAAAKTYLGAAKAHQGAPKAHQGAPKAHQGAAKAHQGASKAHQAAARQQATPVIQQIAATQQAGAATQQPVVTTPVVVTPSAPVPAASSLNQQVVGFLSQKLGQRVGSGECADLAVEALRVAGAKFSNIAPDSPNPGDYVWGAAVKTYTGVGGQAVDSAPGSAIQPGDVLQFDGATFSNGVTATHHTAIVAAVDSTGHVTQVFEQNVMSPSGVANRTDTLDALDLAGLTSGTVAVYQPIARVATAGSATFTVVNNAATSETVTLGGMAVALNAAGTAGSMTTITASGLTQLVVNGQTVSASDGAGYQIVGNGGSTTVQPVA